MHFANCYTVDTSRLVLHRNLKPHSLLLGKTCGHKHVNAKDLMYGFPHSIIRLMAFIPILPVCLKVNTFEPVW